MKQVCVLMSTYNGEKYIETQIDSILKQKNVKVVLMVRDDGSSDNTCSILQNYKEKGLLDWYTGGNLGPAKSFLDLLNHGPVSDYYAFADQDDYWLEDKLCRAIDAICSSEGQGPKLYFSSKTIVDADLKELGVPDEPVRGVGLQYSLIRGFAAGCTMVFNKELYSRLVEYKPEVTTMHDAWVLMVAGAIGKVIYDDKSGILYRQHSNNTIGNQTRIKKFRRHLNNLSKLKNDRTRIIMVKQLVNQYGTEMDAKDLYHARLMSSVPGSVLARLKMAFSNYYKTQVKTDILPYKALIILGWI